MVLPENWAIRRFCQACSSASTKVTTSATADRTVVVQAGVHREQLPAVVGRAQTEEARQLLLGARVQPLEQGVIADAAGVHVVIARKRVDRDVGCCR